MPQMGQAGWMARWSRFESKYQLGLINYLELVYKHPRNVSKRFQKDMSSRARGSTENLLISAWDRVIGLV